MNLDDTEMERPALMALAESDNPAAWIGKALLTADDGYPSMNHGTSNEPTQAD